MKPIHELKISGTYNESRHGDRVETPKASGIPQAPDHLNEAEVKVFSAIAELMYQNESLANLDVYALELYSSQLILFRKAKAELERTGEYVVQHTNKNGSTNQAPSPWLTVLKNSTDQLLKLGAKLGLSPADRNKISKVLKDDNEDYSLLKDPHKMFK